MNENSEGIWNFIIKIAQRDAIKSIFKNEVKLERGRKSRKLRPTRNSTIRTELAALLFPASAFPGGLEFLKKAKRKKRDTNFKRFSFHKNNNFVCAVIYPLRIIFLAEFHARAPSAEPEFNFVCSFPVTGVIQSMNLA